MEETQNSNLNKLDIEPKPSLKQENNGFMEGGQQSSIGSGNTQSQGNNNQVVVNSSSNSVNNTYYGVGSQNNILSSNRTSTLPEALKITEVSNDYKYGGRLVSISLQFYEVAPHKKVRVMLTLSFSQVELEIPNQNRFLNNLIKIEFGIKRGDLYLNLKNGLMPLDKRETIENLKNNWTGEFIGVETPLWRFKPTDNLNSQNQLKVLDGSVKEKELGIINLSNPFINWEIIALFKISLDRSYVEITHLDGEINKKQRESKIALLLKHLKKHDLENYVSKVNYKYDSTTIS